MQTQITKKDKKYKKPVMKEKTVCVVDNTPGSEMHTKSKEEFVSLVSQLREVKQTIGVHFFELGSCLMEIRDKKLWKHTKSKNFGEFVESEGITRQSAYNMISVAKNLTRDEAKELGPSLSYAVATANDEVTKQELLDLAKQGVPAKEIKKISTKKRNINVKVTPPKKIKSGLQVHSGNGGTRNLEVSKEELKKSKEELKKEDVFNGILKLRPIPKGKPKVKHGWSHRTSCELSNNLVCDVEVNFETKQIKLHIR